MLRVKDGVHVSVSYEGRLENGEIFESTADSGPLEFQIGTNSIFPAFEKALINMAVGEKKTILLNPEEAYGPWSEDLTHTINRSVLSENITPEKGMILGLNMERNGETQKVPAMVTAMEGDMVTVDFNHPLAGKTVIYDITLLEIKENAS